MQLQDSLVLALALNIDSAVLGMSMGLLVSQKNSSFALKWALFFGGFQGALFLLGFVGFKILAFLHPISHLLAGSVFLVLGFKLILSVMNHQEESVRLPESLGSSVLFSLSISLDAFFSSVSGLRLDLGSVFKVSILIALVGILMTFFATYFAGQVKKTHRRSCLFVGSLLLIFLGVKSFL